MASIKGLSLKSSKASRDHDGGSAHSADLYFNGNKVGHFSEGYMGNMDVDAPEEIKALFKNYETTILDGDTYKTVKGDIEFAIYDLLDLNKLEKEYKNAVKQTGRSVYIKIRLNWRTTNCYTLPANNAVHSDEKLINAVVSQLANPELEKLDRAAFIIIKDLNYFVKA